jgi:hypothetical protein
MINRWLARGEGYPHRGAVDSGDNLKNLTAIAICVVACRIVHSAPDTSLRSIRAASLRRTRLSFCAHHTALGSSY